MSEFFTTFNKEFLEEGKANEAMRMLAKSTRLFRIPPTAKWSASVRGFGIVVFAEWDIVTK